MPYNKIDGRITQNAYTIKIHNQAEIFPHTMTLGCHFTFTILAHICYTF